MGSHPPLLQFKTNTGSHFRHMGIADKMDEHSMHDMHSSMNHGAVVKDHAALADNDSEDGAMKHDDMMKMYFHGGYNEVILFSFWRISSVGGLVGSMIGCFLLGVLSEGLKFFREFMLRQEYRSAGYSNVNPTPESTIEEDGSDSIASVEPAAGRVSDLHDLQHLAVRSGGHGSCNWVLCLWVEEDCGAGCWGRSLPLRLGRVETALAGVVSQLRTVLTKKMINLHL